MQRAHTSGEESLSLLVDRTRSAGIDFSLSGVNRSVMAVMKRTHLLAKIGEDHVYPTTNMPSTIFTTGPTAAKMKTPVRS